MRYNYILIVMIINLLFHTAVIAQVEHTTGEVVVTAGRTPTSIPGLSRNVIIISAEEIKNIPFTSVSDILNYFSGIDLKQRGVNGIQSDLSIRGGTFEQSLVMINGIKIIDPQTGHHNLNLPFTAADIERIEIVKGQAAKSFGPNAFSGVVNIITKTSTGSRMYAGIEAGENGLYDASVSGSFNINNYLNRLSLTKNHSDGYRFNTGFDQTVINYAGSFGFKSGSVRLMYGYNEKDFGANSFYSVRFPKQAEHTKTHILTLSSDFELNRFILSPKIYWRKNEDEFLLDKDNPSFYKNNHESNTLGFELQSTISTNLGKTSLGFEFTNDDLTSNNLGDHERDRKGIFFEHIIEPVSGVNVNLGGFVYNYSNYGWKIWPGVDVGYLLSDETKIFVSTGKAFRVPTYTELYYNDPVTIGNSKLKFEEVLNYELGINYKSNLINSSVSLFRREGKDIIDWVRKNDEQPWTVRNISEINTNGVEIEFGIYLADLIPQPIKKLKMSYTYLHSDKITFDLESRYALDHLKNQIIINVTNDLFLGIIQSWFIRYEDRYNFDDHFIVDMQLRTEINSFDIYIKAANLFNKSYIDIAGVPLPGRWITAGVKYEIEF